MTVAIRAHGLPSFRLEPPSISNGQDIRNVANERQILIDVSTIAQVDARTGIQRVVRAVASALQKLSTPSATVRLIAASRTSFYRVLPDNWLSGPAGRRLDLSTLPPVSANAGDIFFGLDFSTSILPQHEQQIAQWRRSGVSISIVLYDLLPMSDGKWFTFRMRGNFRRWLKFTKRHADLVIAISRTVADQFEEWQDRSWLAPARRVPVAVARLGSDISASLPSRGLPSDSQAILEWMGSRPTVLMVGTVEPRKGHSQALDAFRLLWQDRDGPQLLMIGRAGWKTSRLQSKLREAAAQESRFNWLEGPSDEFLEQIYQRASGLLVASNGEGFGLPIVEGLSHGLPILVRDLPVFRELEGPGVTFFAGRSASDLAQALIDWRDSGGGTSSTLDWRTHSWGETASDIMALLLSSASTSIEQSKEFPQQ